MKLITEQQRVELYRNSPEDIRELYTSETLIDDIDHLIELFKITKPYKEVSEIISDTILGFYKIADMPRLFQQKLDVTPEVAQKMTAQLIEFLSPVVEREEATSKEVAESKATLIQTFANPQPKEEREVSSQPYTYVTPLRTMEADMTRVHGYGAYVQQRDGVPTEEGETISSSQDDLLGQK